MKNIVIREKSRKMSREGYDARWNRRITLEGGQLFSYIYIYIKEDRLPETEDQVVLVQNGWTRRGCRKEIFSSHLLLASWEIGLLLVLKI